MIDVTDRRGRTWSQRHPSYTTGRRAALVEGHDWAQIGHKTAESTSAAVERDTD